MDRKQRLENEKADFEASFELLKSMIEHHVFQNYNHVTVVANGYTNIEFHEGSNVVSDITSRSFNVDFDSLTANEVECISDLMKIMQRIENLEM